MIPEYGLCIAFYDFVEIEDSKVYPGDGAWHTGGIVHENAMKRSKIPHDPVSASGGRDHCGNGFIEQHERYSSLFRVYG